jgi:uncharacterized membrane protein
MAVRLLRCEPGQPKEDSKHEKGGAMTVAPSPIHSQRVPHRFHIVLAAILVLLLITLAVVLLVRYDVFGGSSSSTGVQGSGVGATQRRELASFSGVELAGSNNVTIHVGEAQLVAVHADDNLIDRVTTEVRAGDLVIGNTPGSFTTRSPMSVEVSVPALTALILTGSGNVSVSGIDAQRLTVALSGSGFLIASGTATRLDVMLSGSGDAELEQVIVSNVDAVVSGSGQIVVTATKSLSASVPGTGAIVYSGNPAQVTKKVSGTGAISAK